MAREKKFVVRKTVYSFKNMLSFSIFTSFVSAIIGIVLFFIPELSDRIIGIVVGTVCILNGFNNIVKFLKRDGAKLYAYNFLFGSLLMILGALIILVPFKVTAFIVVMLGLYIITLGACKLTYAIWLKIGSDKAWLLTSFVAILLIAIGIIVIANPFNVILTLTQIVGTFIVISSSLDIVNTLMIRSRAEKIIEIFW